MTLMMATVPDSRIGITTGGSVSPLLERRRQARRPDGHPRRKLEKRQTAASELYEEDEADGRMKVERGHLEELGHQGPGTEGSRRIHGMYF